jgi:predicted ribonuclease YlaK
MEKELEINRQTILEGLDTFKINENKNTSKKKIKFKFNFDDIDDNIDNNNDNNNNNSDNNNDSDNDNNNNNINQRKRKRKQIVIKNPQMHETLNADPLKINNSDYTNDREWSKEQLFKYYNILDNTKKKK